MGVSRGISFASLCPLVCYIRFRYNEALLYFTDLVLGKSSIEPYCNGTAYSELSHIVNKSRTTWVGGWCKSNSSERGFIQDNLLRDLFRLLALIISEVSKAFVCDDS